MSAERCYWCRKPSESLTVTAKIPRGALTSSNERIYRPACPDCLPSLATVHGQRNPDKPLGNPSLADLFG